MSSIGATREATLQDQPAPSGRRVTPANAWRWFLAWEAVWALIYFPFGVPSGKPLIFGVIPWMEWPGQVPAWSLLGLSAVGAIVYGIKRYRPNAPMAWWFMAAGVFLFIAGDTTYKFWHQILGQQNIPFPSFIDVIYLTMYPVLAVGLLLLARARVPGGDRASLLDGLTITLGIGLLSWIFLIGPNIRASGGLLVRLTAAAYPLGDVLVLAMLAHLWSAGGFRNPAGRLLAIGTIGTLVADSVYGLANLSPTGNWSDGNIVDLGWIVFYACWGAAALHPSMRELSQPRQSAPTLTTYRRLKLLAVVSLIAPAVLLVKTALGDTVDAPVIAVFAAAMFLLVLLRMAGLVQAHGQAVAREQVLRRSAAELVAAPGRDEIYEAAIGAVSALVADHGDITGVVFSVASPSGDLTTVASWGDPAEGPSSLDALSDEVRACLAMAKTAVYVAEADPARPATAGQEPLEQLVCPLVVKDHVLGLITVTSTKPLPFALRSTIEILAAQVELALDRENMTEAVHARRSEARFQTLVQNASDVILIVRPDTTIVYQTPSASRILGYAPGSLEGRRFTSLLHIDDVEKALAGYTGVAFRAGTSITAEWRVQHQEGSWRDMEVITTNLLGDPTVEGIVLTMRDVTERKRLEEELKHQAFHDALSGLANRALFRDRLEHALARASRSRSSLAVLFLDLDDFKLVNDSLGHPAGDRLLVAVAGRIGRSLRGGDTAARFGGDEFAILLEETSGPDEACEVAERIIADLRAPLTLEDHQIQIRASIGIALSPAGEEDPAELMQAADVAMYAAKARGKGCYQTYEPALQMAMVERLEKTADLQRAIDAAEFVVFYQPIMSLSGGEAVGLEALVRWQHPERGLLLPEQFMDLAEETGLIVPLGRFVLKEACLRAREFQLAHPVAGDLRLTVNVSAKHFQHDQLVGDVSQALIEADLDPRCLVIEIVETVFLSDAEAVIARMEELKALGVSFAIDDFGTGYSSLSYLRRFPIDILKLDKSFVDDVGGIEVNGALAETIVQLGHTLHLQTVAEGIEQASQVDALRAFGCTYGQGFYLAKPLAADKVSEFLAELPAATSTLGRDTVGSVVPTKDVG